MDSFGGYARSQLHRMEKYEKQGYMGARRYQLVQMLGYDPKNASHLIRLLKMAIELLRDGYPQVFRTEDQKELLEIKNGVWTLDRIKEYAEELFEEAKKAKENSKLRERPDASLANRLVMRVVANRLGIIGVA
jgi:uncharacterized protein